MAISSVDDLKRHLQWAIALEHATLPPYLCALYSLKPGTNQRARETIESVFIEEMLHLTMAANILNAVGGEPALDTPDVLPDFPTFLPHSDQSFEVSLLKFSPQALETFMLIERPEAIDAAPADENYATIGQFYDAIMVALKNLAAELGEDALFCGDPARQVSPDTYNYSGSGRIIAVTDLASATAALEEIVEQGEGLTPKEVWDGDRDMFHPEREEVAHYFRFQELAEGRAFQRGDTPASGPTGEPIEVDFEAVHDMRPNPSSADYAEGSEARKHLHEFNATYSGVLHLLDKTFNGSPRLLAVATGLMYGLRDQANALMELPTGDGTTTVGPSFEYVPPDQRHIGGDDERRIVVLPNGPYLVYGDVPLVRKRKLVSANNDSIAWQKVSEFETEGTYALCRCGHSTTKPFCDGTHARIGFDGTETADPEPTRTRQRVLDGHGVVIRRDGPLCMHAAFCVGRVNRIPEMLKDADDSDVRAHVIALIERCPSGSYTYALTEDGPDVEADYPTQIAVTEEEEGIAGALWVTGGIPVHRSDGQPFETRNRVTLCRCGQSANKPLCDGTHRKIEFREGETAIDAAPAAAAG